MKCNDQLKKILSTSREKLKSISYLGFYILAFVGLLPLLIDLPAFFFHILIMAFIWALLASSWNFLTGFSGQMSFGHAGFYAVGAYSAASLSLYLGISPWISMILGGLIAAACGFAIGIPSLRLKGIFLALVTLTFAETVRGIVTNWTDVTRGWLGLYGYPTFPEIPTPYFGYQARITYFYIIYALLVSGIVLIYYLEKSDFGLRLKAIRENETLAKAVGINTTYYKLSAFIISAFIAGIAGGFYAFYILVLTPSIGFVASSAQIIAMTLLGGLGTVWGPIAGAVGLSVVQEISRLVIPPVYNLLAISILIILIILFAPKGLIEAIRKKT